MVKGRVPHYELIVTINAKYCTVARCSILDVASPSVSKVVKEMVDIS